MIGDMPVSHRNSVPGTAGESPGFSPATTGAADLVARWVRARPGALAVRDPATGEALTYRELWDRSGELAGELAARGIRPGDLVAVDLPRSADLVVAFLGVVRACAAYIPLDINAPAGRLEAIFEESGARVVVSAAGQGSGRWALPPDGMQVVPVPGGTPAAAAPEPPPGSAAGEDRIYVTYTSGSTGRPKGVEIPHRAVHRLVVAPNYCTIEPGDRVANTCNPAFDVTTCEIWSTLCSGAAIVPFPLITDVTLEDWADLIRAERIDTMFLTTSLFHMVARERPAAFASMRDLVVGGEQLDLAAVRRVLAAGPPRRLVNGYGPTEATAFATYFECTNGSLAGADRVPIGYPLQQTTAHVLADDLRPVPAGEPGELCLGGPGVALGYLNRPQLTAERFVTETSTGERVYRTGDLVRMLPTGALEMLGRKDRQVKLRGFRIELEEIERVAVATGLADAAFVEKRGDGVAAELVGFVLPGPAAAGAAADLPAALGQRMGERLPAYMLPSRWLVLPSLPVGSNGKADRAQMLALLTPAPSGGPVLADPVLAAVREILHEIIGVADAAPAANFIDLGGNSILAVQVASRLHQRLGVQVEPADVLLADSLAEMAGQLATAEHA
jgi:amino acid adenylation domain-containing protein